MRQAQVALQPKGYDTTQPHVKPANCMACSNPRLRDQGMDRSQLDKLEPNFSRS
jgi:hypothetical protein